MQSFKRWLRKSNGPDGNESTQSGFAGFSGTLGAKDVGADEGPTLARQAEMPSRSNRTSTPPAVVTGQPAFQTSSAGLQTTGLRRPSQAGSAGEGGGPSESSVPTSTRRQSARQRPKDGQQFPSFSDNVPMVPQRRLSEGRKGKDVAVAGAEMSDNIQPMDVDVVSTEAMGTRTVSVEGTLADPQRAGSPTDSAFDLEDSDCRIDFLTTLPYEIAIQIFSFLPSVGDVCQASLVCRAWYNMSRDNEVWKTQFIDRWARPLPLSLPRGATLGPPLPLTGPRSNSFGLVPAERIKPQDYRELYRQRDRLNRNWMEGRFDCRKVEGHTDSVYCVQFDDKTIISGSRDRTIKWWDMRSGKNYRTVFGHEGSVLCLQYNGSVTVPFFSGPESLAKVSEGIVVSGSSDSTMMLWDFASGERIGTLRGHSSPVLDVRFNESCIVSCSKDCTIKVWNLDAEDPVEVGSLQRTLEGHHAAVNAVYLHRNLVTSASGDCTVKLWDLNTGGCIRDFVGHSRGLACVQFDGRLIVSGSNDKSVKVWDARSGICARTFDGAHGHTELVRTLSFDNERIVSGSYDQAIKVWDLRAAGQHENQPLLDLREAHTSWVFHVQMSGRRIVSASQDRKIVVWDFGRGIPESWKFV